MSGTSADGIDAVVAEISEHRKKLRARLVTHIHRRFAPGLQRQILKASLDGNVAEICELNFLLGRHFGRAALGVISRARLKPHQITAIASHGQTIHHLPNAATPSTLQIGEPAMIAEMTGVAVVADFRVADIAAGGQGAPLVPFADWVLFTHPRHPRIIQNIGGIANLTFLPPRAEPADIIAFDTGPGNMVIDAVAAALSNDRLRYDRNGAWAARGTVSETLLKQLKSHPFLKQSPPKTTGREDFGQHFAEAIVERGKKLRLAAEDIIASATAFTPATIVSAYRRFVLPRIRRDQWPKLQIILGGGGTKNHTLIRTLAHAIESALANEFNFARHTRTAAVSRQILTHDHFGIPSSAKEALAFAILAHETLAGRPSNVPSATGATRRVVLGKIVPGK